MGLSKSLICVCLALIALGCGGTGSAGLGGTSGGTTGGTPRPLNNATALVRVDVKTHDVTITPLSGNAKTNKIFQGDRIGFKSSLRLDEPGDVGRKILHVSLVNHSAE